MRTTLNLDDDLVKQAQDLSLIKEKTALVHAALRTLIAVHSAERLAALGGTEKNARSVPRRRSRKNN